MNTYTVTVTHKPIVRPKVTYGKVKDQDGVFANLTAFDRTPFARTKIAEAPIGAVLKVTGTESTNNTGARQIVVETLIGDGETFPLNPEPDFGTVEAAANPFDFDMLIAAGWQEVPYPAKWKEPNCRYLLSPAHKATYELKPDGRLKFVLPYNL